MSVFVVSDLWLILLLLGCCSVNSVLCSDCVKLMNVFVSMIGVWLVLKCMVMLLMLFMLVFDISLK